jgi:hypothetical protein
MGPELSEQEKQREIREIVQQLRAIEKDLSPQEIQIVHKNLVYKNLPLLPAPRQTPAREIPRVAVSPEPQPVSLERTYPMRKVEGSPPPLRYHNRIMVSSVRKS